MNYNQARKNIQCAIISRFKTQKEFAQKTGVTKAQVSRILNGQRKISLEFFMRVCEVTGKSPNELMGWTNEQR